MTANRQFHLIATRCSRNGLDTQPPQGMTLPQGNESRLTPERLVLDLAKQIKSEVADDGHILGALSGAQA